MTGREHAKRHHSTADLKMDLEMYDGPLRAAPDKSSKKGEMNNRIK